MDQPTTTSRPDHLRHPSGRHRLGEHPAARYRAGRPGAGAPVADARADDVLQISCDTCVMRATAACDDCLVTYICDERGVRVDGGAVVFDLAELRAVKMLADAGLVPTLRHRAAR